MPKYDYQDIGYFTKNESNEPFDLYSDESSDITQRIESNFGISRKKHGTSFVIFHPEKIQKQVLIRTIILQWFTPILLGNLSIEIKKNTTDTAPIILDDKKIMPYQIDQSENIEKFLNDNVEKSWTDGPGLKSSKDIQRQISKEDHDKILNDWIYAKWIIFTQPNTPIKLKTIKIKTTLPLYSLDPIIKSKISQIKKALSEQEYVLISIPLKFNVKSTNETVEDEFQVAIIKSRSAFGGNYFLRGEIAILNYVTLTKKPFITMTQIMPSAESQIGKCISQFEDKAHSDLNEDVQKVDFKNANNIKKVTTQIANKIIEIIESDSAKNEVLSPNILSKIFPGKIGETGGGGNGGNNKFDPYTEPNTLKLINNSKGFEYSVTANKHKTPKEIIITINHAIPKGERQIRQNNKIWHNILDFNLSRVKFNYDGCEVKEIQPNKVILSEISSQDIYFSVINGNFNSQKNLMFNIDATD